MKKADVLAARASADAGFVIENGRLKMTMPLDLNDNRIVNLGEGVDETDAGRNSGGGGGDARTLYTRTFQISAATIAAKGTAWSANFEIFTLTQNEGIRWCWMQNAAAFTGGTMWAQFGVITALNSLYLQQNVSAIGHYDDNSMHGTSFQTYGEMGDKKYSSSYNVGDATTYFRTGNTIHLNLQTYGGAKMNTIGGGDLRLHFEIVRVDPDQMETI